jgi:hypothetical protein
MRQAPVSLCHFGRLFLLILFFQGAVFVQAKPVEFRFTLPVSEGNPFSRQVWAEVALPSGAIQKLPAFYVGEGVYAVRARAGEKGSYRLKAVSEEKQGDFVLLKIKVQGARKLKVKEPAVLSAIRIDPKDGRRFSFESGERFDPIGMNLAWPTSDTLPFYEQSFGKMSSAGLNWARIWMAHWSGLNLDWRKDKKPSPSDGTLDLEVAATWDRIVDSAETRGIYVQLVLQHHGQYSSRVNPNWADNPWNVANGGFLTSASELFTSPRAIEQTRAKFRYIVARWGYSPSIMAWELFNEVHWVDAIGNQAKNDAAVAKWHSEMAAFVRSLDVYHHLVTTSTENLHSEIYAGMDYYQPHNYAPEPINGVRVFSASDDELKRPVFYGEVGDDQLPLPAEVKKAGGPVVPPVWASLMGSSRYLAQPWLGWDLMESKERLTELQAVARFSKAVAHVDRDTLKSFSAVVEMERRQPFVLPAGFYWQRRPNTEINLPLDGREPEDFGRVSRVFMNATESPENGYASRSTYHLDLGRAVTFALQISPSAEGGSLRVSVDGAEAISETWPKPPAPDEKLTAVREYKVQIPSGRHTLVIENPGDHGSFDIRRFGADVEVPVLACIGRRNENFVMAWVWNREGVYKVDAASAETGTVVIENLPAGRWTATWWNSVTGEALAPTTLAHPGGVLRLPTPAISRHAALILERQK